MVDKANYELLTEVKFFIRQKSFFVFLKYIDEVKNPFLRIDGQNKGYM